MKLLVTKRTSCLFPAPAWTGAGFTTGGRPRTKTGWPALDPVGQRGGRCGEPTPALLLLHHTQFYPCCFSIDTQNKRKLTNKHLNTISKCKIGRHHQGKVVQDELRRQPTKGTKSKQMFEKPQSKILRLFQRGQTRVSSCKATHNQNVQLSQMYNVDTIWQLYTLQTVSHSLPNNRQENIVSGHNNLLLYIWTVRTSVFNTKRTFTFGHCLIMGVGGSKSQKVEK